MKPTSPAASKGPPSMCISGVGGSARITRRMMKGAAPPVPF
jgi:hypothetical protein